MQVIACYEVCKLRSCVSEMQQLARLCVRIHLRLFFFKLPRFAFKNQPALCRAFAINSPQRGELQLEGDGNKLSASLLNGCLVQKRYRQKKEIVRQNRQREEMGRQHKYRWRKDVGIGSEMRQVGIGREQEKVENR